MTPSKEQIIEWVRAVADRGTVDPVSTGALYITLTPDEFQRFTALAITAAYANGQEDMRERCAQEGMRKAENGIVVSAAIRAIPITQHSDAQPCDTERAIEAALAGKAGQQCNGMGIQDGQGDKCPLCDGSGTQPTDPATEWMAVASSAVLALSDAASWLPDGQNKRTVALAADRIQERARALYTSTQQPLHSHENELKAMERYIAMITKDRDSAHDFLTRAGIIDSNGNLSEQYRDIVETEARHRHHRE